MLSFFIMIPIRNIISGRGNGLGFVFLLGSLIYYIYRFIDYKTAKILFPISIVAYIIQSYILKEAYQVVSFFNLSFIIAFGLIACQNIIINRNKILAYISNSTFMLYLIHYTIIDFILNTSLNIDTITKFWLGIIISVVSSLLIYRIISCKKIMLHSYKTTNRP